MPEATVRFYAELNDFLPRRRRGHEFGVVFDGTPSVKDLIESCGVPHPEIELLLVDGVSVGFGYQVRGGERIAAYPVFESFDVSPLIRLRPEPLREPRFVVDANLGRLARLLRLFGFDALYRRDIEDAEVVEISARQHRIILTRDRGLLMRREVTHGCYIRSTDPKEQLAETIERLDLDERIAPLSRCTECNGLIETVEKESIEGLLPARTRRHYDTFFRCEGCGKLYWRGAHQAELTALIDRVRSMVLRRRAG